jgi:hypothetical protein
VSLGELEDVLGDDGEIGAPAQTGSADRTRRPPQGGLLRPNAPDRQ